MKVMLELMNNDMFHFLSGIQSVQIHYFLKDNARPKGFLLHSKTTRREVMVKHEANGGDYGGANFDMAKKMAGMRGRW